MMRTRNDQRGSATTAPAPPTARGPVLAAALVPAWWYGMRGPLAPAVVTVVTATAMGTVDLAGGAPAWVSALASHLVVACMAVLITAVYVSGTLRDNGRAGRTVWAGGVRWPGSSGAWPSR